MIKVSTGSGTKRGIVGGGSRRMLIPFVTLIAGGSRDGRTSSSASPKRRRGPADRQTRGGATVRIVVYSVIAAVAAALINACIWLGGRGSGVTFRVQPPGRPPSEVELGPVLLFSAVPVFLGGTFYGLLRRWTRRPLLVFVVLAALVFSLLLVPPITSTTHPGTQFALILMHGVATATVLLAVFRFEQHARRF